MYKYYKKERDAYNNYQGKKAIYTTYLDRIKKGSSFEEAIKLKIWKIKGVIKSNWRTCSKCWEFKIYKYFYKKVNWPKWHACNCKNCENKIRLKYYYTNKWKKYNIEYKRKYRKTQRWKLVEEAYKLYKKYNQNNINILKSIWEKITVSRTKEMKKDLLKRLWIERFKFLYE